VQHYVLDNPVVGKERMCWVPTSPETSWKTLYFGVKFPGPGKSWKRGLVLESPGNFCARSWNFLSYDVGGGHNNAGADAKIWEN